MSNTPTAEEFLRALPPVLRNDSRMIALGQVIAEELSDRMSEIEKAAIGAHRSRHTAYRFEMVLALLNMLRFYCFGCWQLGCKLLLK